MKQLFLFSLFFLLTIGLVIGAGEFGAGTYGEGEYGFGTPEPELAVTEPAPSSSGGGSSGGGGGYVRDGLTKGSKTTTLNYADVFLF